jgi:NDP-sugar pyrophosphorylase family protein
MIKKEIMEELQVSTNNLTVLILAAGYGRRMGPFSRMVNKSLVPYGDKPLISHIMERFPKDTKFVIACGHMGQQVEDYVSTVHSDKNLVFVNIPDYSEGNTGPATTIRHCAEHIRGGFLWLACDTVFDFDYKSRMDHNWIGVYPVDSTISQDYCWVRRDGDDIVDVQNKTVSPTAVDAFIGLMYCKDDEYLDNLIARGAKETYQGFEGLELKAHTVKEWLDFGTYEKWHELNSKQPENSFVKPDELFYHDNGKVIKYFSHVDHVLTRYVRALANPECMPKNMTVSGNFLIHDWAKGDIMYNQLTPELFKKMLAWCETTVWVTSPNGDYSTNFYTCQKFYHDKTIERINQFRVKYADWSECCVVNRKEVDSIDQYLNRIDWDLLLDTRHWGFVHGDLHFDNTIYDPQFDQFTAIDWRTDFAGETYGDIYYDLAKMLGGIWLDYRKVKNGELDYTERSDYATLIIPSVDDAQVYEDILRGWVERNGLNWKKVKLLVPIIYLNMAPLHEPPFDKFLIALAQLHFSKVL